MWLFQCGGARGCGEGLVHHRDAETQSRVLFLRILNFDFYRFGITAERLLNFQNSEIEFKKSQCLSVSVVKLQFVERLRGLRATARSEERRVGKECRSR